MRLDHCQAPFGVHAVPCERVAGGDVQPVQFADHPQARLVGVEHRRGAQLLGDLVRRRLQGLARLGHPHQQCGRRNLEAVHINDQLGGAGVRQYLTLGQMHHQRAHVAAVLHQFCHAAGNAAHVDLAAAAGHGQRTVFDEIERVRRHVDDLVPLGYFGLCQLQNAVAERALVRQRMVDCFGRFVRPLERVTLVPRPGTGLVAGRLAQRIGLVQAIG